MATKTSPKPNLGELQELYTDRKDNVFAGFQHEYDIDFDHLVSNAKYQKRVMAKYLKGFMKGYPIKSIPIAQWAVQNLQNALLSGETPRVRVFMANKKRKDADDTGAFETKRHKVEAWLQSVVHWMDHHSTMETPLRDFVGQTGGLGVGFLCMVPDKSLWPDEPGADADAEEMEEYAAACRGTFPFSCYTVPGRNVLWDNDNEPYRDVFVVDKISRRQVAQLYPHITESGKSSKRDVERRTYVSKDWYAVIVDGQWAVDPKANPWRRIWYQGALSGMGIQGPDYELEYRVQGIIRPNRDLIAAALTNFNHKEAARALASLGGKDFRSPSSDDDAVQRTMEKYDTSPAAQNTLYGDVVVTNTPQPELPAWMGVLDAEIQQYLEVAFGTWQAVRGITSTDNATVNLQNREAVLRQFMATKKACEQALAQTLMNLLEYVKLDFDECSISNMHEDGVLSLSPQDIPENIRIVVDFSPPTVEERNANKQGDQADRDAGLISDKTYLELQRPEVDYETERLQILEEKLFFTESLLQLDAQVISQRVQQEYGLADQRAKEAEARKGVIRTPNQQAVEAAPLGVNGGY